MLVPPSSLAARWSLALFAVLLGYVCWPGAPGSALAPYANGERPAHASAVFGPAGLLLEYAPPFGSVSCPGNAASAPAAKDRVSGAAAIVRVASRSAAPSSARIQRTAATTLVALRRCALLFPFHFFW